MQILIKLKKPLLISILFMAFIFHSQIVFADECQTDDECQKAQMCVNGRCVPRECNSNDECQKQQMCVRGRCVPRDEREININTLI